LGLWTWQLARWHITAQRRDPAAILEAWGAEMAEILKPLYERLYQELGTQDFVWCFTKYEHWKQLEVRRLWELDVPRDDVLRYIDSPVWQGLINLAKRSPAKVANATDWGRLLLEEEEALRRMSAESGGDVEPLLRVPIDASWVIDNRKFNKGPDYSNAALADLPTCENEAKRCRREWN